MRPDTKQNWTPPGSDSFDQKQFDSAPEGSCVYCGDYDPDFRQHFMTHYAANGGEYGRYAAAYSLGHEFAHRNHGGEWSGAERDLRTEWERRAQQSWEEVKEAVHYGWSRAAGRK